MIEYCRFILRWLYKFACLINMTLSSCSSSELTCVLRINLKSVAILIYPPFSYYVFDVHPSVSVNSPFVDDILLEHVDVRGRLIAMSDI